MSQTAKGHELIHVKDLTFNCLGSGIGFNKALQVVRAPNCFCLASHMVHAPTDKGRIIAELRAWLAVYDDEELLAQVEGVVAEAVARLPESDPLAATPQAAADTAQN
jgi:hypothetical protein